MPLMEPNTYAALKESIKRWGVLVPVLMDMNGRILDGHHRAKIAEELGIEYPTNSVAVDGDVDAEAVAITVNVDRRHMPPEQRRAVVAHLRSQGHSLRAIAGAVGVSAATVHGDVAQVFRTEHLPTKTTGSDGKSYPATRKEADVEAADDTPARRPVATIERPPAPPRYGGNRRKHADQIEAVCHALQGLVIAFEDVSELDKSVTQEEAARLMGDLSARLRAFRHLKQLLQERISS